jgi:alkylation response protein AidB-like acyl-CoA dehydrogenase
MDCPAKQDAIAAARAVGPAIAAAADTVESTRRIPPALAEALHAARLFRLLLPHSVGGEEVDPGTYFRAIAEVARHDASVAWNVFVGNSAALIAAFLAPAEALAIFADPRTVVAWAPPNEAIAEAVPGGYRVSGRFDFASGCRLANWMGVHCRVREADGTLRPNHLGRPAIRTLLFPARQAELLDTWHTIGLRGTASDSYTVTDVFVPEAFSTTREQPEARREPGRLYAFTMQGLYAVGVAGVALGTARAMLDAFMVLAMDKTPRGLSKLAEVMAGAGSQGAIGTTERARVRLGCAQAIHAAVEVADWCHRAAGVDAIFPGSPFERRFRDIHTLSQQIQSRSAHFTAAGQAMLGHAPVGFL